MLPTEWWMAITCATCSCQSSIQIKWGWWNNFHYLYMLALHMERKSLSMLTPWLLLQMNSHWGTVKIYWCTITPAALKPHSNTMGEPSMVLGIFILGNQAQLYIPGSIMRCNFLRKWGITIVSIMMSRQMQPREVI